LDKEQKLLVQRIVSKIFKRYCPRGESGYFTREDLFHYGIIGLLTAKENFKKNMNVPFNAYAAIRIRGEIMDAIRKSPHVRLPQEKRKQFNMLSWAINDFLNQGITPTSQDLAQKLGWEVKTVLKIETLLNQVSSIDAEPGFKEIVDKNQMGNAEKNDDNDGDKPQESDTKPTDNLINIPFSQPHVDNTDFRPALFHGKRDIISRFIAERNCFNTLGPPGVQPFRIKHRFGKTA